jgi:hypothetical protein
MAARRSSRSAASTRRYNPYVDDEITRTPKKKPAARRRQEEEEEIAVTSPSDTESIVSASDALEATNKAHKELLDGQILHAKASITKILHEIPKSIKKSIAKGIDAVSVKFDYPTQLDNSYSDPLVEYIRTKLGTEKKYQWWIYRRAEGCTTRNAQPRFFAAIWWTTDTEAMKKKMSWIASGVISDSPLQCQEAMMALA